jgi:peptidyl-prolyl cis-trans isomerase D
MMKIMRKHAKIVIWIVVVVFGGGTVVLIWGAGGVDKFVEGLFGREKRGTIVTINGESVHFTVFQYYYDQALRRAEKEQGDVDEQTAYQIREDVWNNLINEMLLNQEGNKRGIQVTDAEMYEYLRRYPPRELQEHPAFQTPEGQFDYQKYLQALSDPRVPWGQVEEMIRPNLRMAKLQQSILSLVRITDEEVQRYYREREGESAISAGTGAAIPAGGPFNQPGADRSILSGA